MRDEISFKRCLLLHPSIRNEVIATISAFETAKLPPNYKVRCVQTLRTFGYQNELAAQDHDGKDNDGDGRIDEPDEHVTNAKAGQSYHNYGLAFDYCFIIDGKVSWVVDKYWMMLVNVFKQLGYTWGGDFKSIKDMPHLEKTFGYNWKTLLNLHNGKHFIEGTEYVKL